jgi:dipeptidyl aminopeptidase/acylaminoacyl peptidase
VLVHASGQGRTGVWSVPVTDGRRDGDPVLVRGGLAAFVPSGIAGQSYYYLVPVDAPTIFTTSIDIPAGQVLSPPVAITSPLDGMALQPAWSPDGRTLAYSLRGLVERGERIMLRAADGDEVRELASIPQSRIIEMAWSPDGETLLVHAQVREGRTLFGVDIRSGEVREVYADLGWAMTIAPDGRLVHVIVADQPERPAGVYVRDLASGQEHRIVERLPSRPAIGVSPDGQRVALVYTDHDSSTAYVATVPIDGGPMHEIARLTYPMHYEPHGFGMAIWTPDARYLLVMRGEWEREGSHEIVALPVDGGEPIFLMKSPEGQRGYALHPDGHRLAYTGGEPRMEMWVLDELSPSAER